MVVTTAVYHHKTEGPRKFNVFTIFVMTETVAWLCKSWQWL